MSLNLSSDKLTFLLASIAMALVVLASNILVMHPFTPFGLSDFLTYGAFTYPIAFLINDLTNRWYGPKAASSIVLIGFGVAVALSIYFATPRIAIASGSAFLFAQLLDLAIFNKLRAKARWWQPPLVSSLLGSTFDTLIFFPLAFYGLGDDFINMTQAYHIFGKTLFMETWVMWAICDYIVKLGVAMVMLSFYRMVFRLQPAL